MKAFCNLLVLLLPWRLKRFCLVRFYGYELHPSARIGFSYVFPRHLVMREGARIGHFNCAIHLERMVMGKGSVIVRGNWITGFPLHTGSRHFAHQPDRRPELLLGDESAITKQHHIDCTDSVAIGRYVTIAGYGSQLLTHSIDIYRNRQDSHPIRIGDYCFVGTGVKILGGARLPACSVLGAGAVLTRAYAKGWKLYAGVPARPVKDLPHDAPYFSRQSGFVF